MFGLHPQAQEELLPLCLLLWGQQPCCHAKASREVWKIGDSVWPCLQLILAIAGTTGVVFLSNTLDEITPIFAATPLNHGGELPPSAIACISIQTLLAKLYLPPGRRARTAKSLSKVSNREWKSQIPMYKFLPKPPLL